MSKKKRIKRPTLSLPLAQAEGNFMLVAIIAVLVFLAGLVWIAGSAAQHMTGRWNHTLANELTIEVAPILDDDAKSLLPVEQRVQAVKEMLAQYAAVTRIETVPREQLQNILKPWLGDISSFPDLPLPTLLEVSLRPGHDINVDDLAEQIAKKIPGVRAIAHYAWAGEVQRLANTIAIIAWAGMGLMGFVLLLLMIFTARARLTMFAAEVEVLHTLGATDGFVAGEFERQAFRLSAAGALIGFVMLLFVMYAALVIAAPDVMPLARLSTNGMAWFQDWHQEILGLLILPVLAIFLNTLAARAAVMSALRRLT